jgi:hypothetical protein
MINIPASEEKLILKTDKMLRITLEALHDKERPQNYSCIKCP